jgi:ankyrin repeat protein|eukprot:COSAG06_NODE_23289_length_696_cov_19.291457_2_plen_83_part_00
MFGYTPFMLACELGATDIISLLVTAGCDTKATDLHQHDGVQIARHAGHGESVNTCLKSVLERNNTQAIKEACRPRIHTVQFR